MTKSIFYKSDSRDENALSHRFLAIYQRLNCDARSFLLKNCGLSFLPDMGNPLSVENQVQLGNRRPDGMIKFSDMAIAFENKVKAVHEDGSDDDWSQLEYYYKQLEKISGKPRLLVAADSTRQNRERIQSLIKGQDICEKHVDIMMWQEVHHACVESLEIWNSDTSSDLDRFLVDELRILLEEMRMESFTGIELEDLEGYARSWHELTLLGEFLKVTVPKEFSMLKPYGGRWGSFHRRYLGFGFPAEWENHAWLYVNIRRDEVLKMAIILEDDKNSQPTSKLLEPGILEKLVPALKAAEGFKVRIGPEKRSVNLGRELQEYRSGNLKVLFDGYLSVEKRYSFGELQKNIGLNTPMFPKKLMVEILKLKPIASIINEGLMGTA